MNAEMKVTAETKPTVRAIYGLNQATAPSINLAHTRGIRFIM